MGDRRILILALRAFLTAHVSQLSRDMLVRSQFGVKP